MHITKIGHCCLLIKLPGTTILTDPGYFSTAQDSLTGIDVVLITHEHSDHLHIDSLKKVLANNPNALVITNSGVGTILNKEGILHLLLEGTGAAATVGADISIEAFDGRHEEIFEEIGQVQNTGYLIASKLFYPGDSYINPERPVEILAFPVAGPWCKVPDALKYVISLKPAKAFPVHDGMIKPEIVPRLHMSVESVLAGRGIQFTKMTEGDEVQF